MADSGFVIEGNVYETPTLDSLNGDESMVLYGYCGLIMEDFAPDNEDGSVSEERQEEIAQKIRHPGFILAMMHIAVQRTHTDWREAKVKRYVGSANLMEALEKFAEEDEAEEADDDENPPSVSEQPESSPKSSDDLSTSSGLASTKSSDEPDDPHVSIGIGGSDTSAE